MTCNIVKEIFYKRNVIWYFKYFGSEGFYRNLQWLSSNGLFLLYAGLWTFKSEETARNHPANDPESTGALENLFVAFQLYLLFGGFAILGFSLEMAFYKGRYQFKIVVILLRFRIILHKVLNWDYCCCGYIKNLI